MLLDRNGVQLAAFVASDGQWRMPLSESQISPHLLNAIVAVEDSRFRSHHGVDWKSVAAAVFTDLQHLRFARGASTITMQVEHLSSRAPRSLGNKLLQAIRAEQLERRKSKSQILLDYVNIAPFGGNLTGAGAASWRYFGRPCADLSVGQAALLAGLPQSPNRLRPDRHPQLARLRRDHVLHRMLECGFIDRSQFDEARAEPVNASWRALPQDRPSDDDPPADGALPTLLTVYGGKSVSTIRTTIDAVIQRQVMNAAREQLKSLESSGVGAAAVVVLDNTTGQSLASVTLGEKDLRIDLTSRPRSTGSTLKPFIYAAAFDAGICGPGTVLSDSLASWGGYEPADYDHQFRGPLTAADALCESRNIPAMMVLSRVGVEPVIGTMDAAGLHALARSPDRYGLTLAVGGADASPIEVAQAYMGLARGGESSSARFVFAAASDPHDSKHFLRAQACWQVLNTLADPGRIQSICPEAVASHVAWKTGTSSGHRDAWCAAVTRRKTVVVWLGNVRGQSSPSLVGQEAAAPLALQLIALLDPRDEPWPIVSASKTPNVQWQPQHVPQLIIRSPADGQRVVIAPDLPRDRQRILLQAAYKQSTQVSHSDQLWWFVDDKPIGTSGEAERLWYEPTPGTHEIRVIDGQAGCAVVKVHVRAANEPG
jgi:penicillin-binding protein 1C